MTSIVCDFCKAKNDSAAELCVVCGQPLVKDAVSRPESPAEREEVEKWVRQLPEFGKSDTEKLQSDDEGLPGWLQAVRAHADQLTEAEADELLQYLTELDSGKADDESGKPDEAGSTASGGRTDLPAWVAALIPEENWPKTEADEALARHFADAEESDEERLPATSQLAETRPLESSVELEGIPDQLAGERLPTWLSDQEESEQKRPASQMPPGWPSRSRRPATSALTPPASDDPGQEAIEEGEPEDAFADALIDAMADTGDEVPENAAEAEAPIETGWMDPVQAAALEETLEEILDLPDADTSEGRVDQWIGILEDLPAGDEAAPLDQMGADLDLDEADVPEWMQALRPSQPDDEPELEDLGPPEESGPLAGLRGIVPAAAISLSGSVDRTSAKLAMSKEQRQQVALLRRLTAIEPEATTASASATDSGDSFFAARLVLGLALLLVVLLGMVFPGAAELLPWEWQPALSPAAVQAQEVVAAAAGQTALVAFDYTPSMAGELDAVAGAILANLATNGSPALTVSQVAAGVPVAGEATAATDGLDTMALGFLPGEASGLRALGACLGRTCETLAGRQLSQETQAALADVALIVVFTADRDSLAGWIEQVGTQSDVAMIGGVTQALGPVARPYVVSEQLSGLVEGLPDATAYDAANQQGQGPSAEQKASLTLAQYLVIVALIAGGLYFGLVEPTASAVGQVAKK